MAAWDNADDLYDRVEADGQAREVAGESVTEAGYPEWLGPSCAAVVAAGESLLSAVDGVIELLESAA